MRRSHISLAVVLLAVVALTARAQASPFEQLLAVKVKGAAKVSASAAISSAYYDALDGTGCTISGPPRMMFVPVTMSPAASDPMGPPLTSAHTDQVYVCYRVHCVDDQKLYKPFRDQFATQFVTLGSSYRLLCVPGVGGDAPCGDPQDQQCGGNCDPGQQCMHVPGHHGSCVCVPTPACGQGTSQCGDAFCPEGYTCGSRRASGLCECLPACSGSFPECDGDCPADSDCFDLGATCGCVKECGKVEAGMCSDGSCPAPKVCKGMVGDCSCQDP